MHVRYFNTLLFWHDANWSPYGNFKTPPTSWSVYKASLPKDSDPMPYPLRTNHSIRIPHIRHPNLQLHKKHKLVSNLGVCWIRTASRVLKLLVSTWPESTCRVWRKFAPFHSLASVSPRFVFMYVMEVSLGRWSVSCAGDMHIGYDHNWSAASSYPIQLMQDAESAFDGVSFHCYAVSIAKLWILWWLIPCL